MSPILEHFAKFAFVIIGHRGAAGLAPENTLKSFDAALHWRCPMVELDVYTTSDAMGHADLLVIHDRQLNRTTNGRGYVTKSTTEYLRSLDAGEGQAIPYLSEVADLLVAHQANTGTTVALNIELKGPDTATAVAAAIVNWPTLPVLVSSFDHRQLQQFRALDPATAVAPLYDKYASNWSQTAKSLAATAVNLSTRVATAARVSAMRRAGYPVFVYTVNNADDAKRFRDMGVSGVFTDRPDKLMEFAATGD